jgi:hypothetical protein
MNGHLITKRLRYALTLGPFGNHRQDSGADGLSHGTEQD